MASDNKSLKNVDQADSRVLPVTVLVVEEEQIGKLKTDSQAVEPREKLSAYFTIAAAAFGLISDGCEPLVQSVTDITGSFVFFSDQNNLMTMSNVVFKRLYPKEYTPNVSTRVSNALLVGKNNARES